MFGSSLFQPGGYRPSGKCNWFKLLTVALPLSLLGACVLAFVLAKVFIWGWYYFVIMPMVAGLLLGVQAMRLFRFAHCRNPYVAGGFGVLLASVMFLGYYHCDFVITVGPRVMTRVDFLPEFINFRLHNDVIHDTHEFGNQKKQPNVYMNWIFFVLDWAMAPAFAEQLHSPRPAGLLRDVFALDAEQEGERCPRIGGQGRRGALCEADRHVAGV